MMDLSGVALMWQQRNMYSGGVAAKCILTCGRHNNSGGTVYIPAFVIIFP